MRKRDLERCRRILLEQQERILGNVDRVFGGELDIDPDDFPDEIDTAVAESSLSFTGRIRERARRLLNKIDKTLEKIDRGVYGQCESCGEEIEVNAWWRARWPSSALPAKTSTRGSSASGSRGRH